MVENVKKKHSMCINGVAQTHITKPNRKYRNETLTL